MPFELSVLDIDDWAGKLPARSQLPRLLRRLALLHSGVERVEFAADEDTQIGGFDGVVVSSGTHPYLPAGLSVWELGVNKDVKGKADDDFEKRSYDSPPKTSKKAKTTKTVQGPTTPPLDRSQGTFIFVTPRRWTANTRWATTQRALGIWKDVRALNAGDLITWLEHSPGVAVWFARLIGKRPPGALDGEAAWEEYAQATNPATSPTLVVGGRSQERDQLLDFLAGPPGVLPVQAESRDEAVAFILGCLHAADAQVRERLLARTVTVSLADTFRLLVSSATPLVLVPTFTETAGLAAAAQAGHHILVPRSGLEFVGPNKIVLPRAHRRAVQDALEGMGVPETRRVQLGRLARRSMLALRRALVAVWEAETPGWADPRQGFPAAILLAGMWHDENEDDQQAVSRLGGAPYLTLARTLTGWAAQPDPPLRRLGGVWTVSAPEDAWVLTKRSLLPQDMTTFEAVAVEVLGVPDPIVTLPPDEQYLQRAIGTPRPYSDHLRTGLTDTLALLGAHAHDPDVAHLNLAPSVARVVTALLGAPATWEAWAALSQWLPQLAEAAPDAFLDAAERLTKEPDVPLAALIQDDEHHPFFHSPHTHLLWALEGLAWYPPYLLRVARVLLALAQRDLPEPTTMNRPLQALKLLFDGQMPGTAATVEQRLATLKTLRGMNTALHDKLLRALLPTQHNWRLEPVTLKYRDWAPDSFPRATPSEYLQFQEGIVDGLLAAGREAPATLAFLLEQAHTLTVSQRAALLQAVREIAVTVEGEAGEALRSALRGVIRNETERSRSAVMPEELAAFQPDVEEDPLTPEERTAVQVQAERNRAIFTPEQLTEVQALLTTLETNDIVEEAVWLFESAPPLPEVPRFNQEAYWVAVQEARANAVRQIWVARGHVGIEALAQGVHDAGQVGSALSEAGCLTWEEEAALLGRTLAHDSAALASLGKWYLAMRAQTGGPDWVERIQTELVPTWTAAQQAEFFLSQPAKPDTWLAVQAAGEEVQRRYWDAVPVWSLPGEQFEAAVEGLLSRGRSFAALHFITNFPPQAENGVQAEMIVRALESVLKVAPTDDLKDAQGMPYLLARLLEKLEPTGPLSLAHLATLEWALMGLLPTLTSAPRNLTEVLDNEPEFFLDVITGIYVADDAPEDGPVPSEAQVALARRGSELLRRWIGVPGLRADGTFDEAHWREWVERARQLGQERGYTRVVEGQLARVIARAPSGPEGIWPHPAVGETIELIASDRLDRHIELEVQNRRGIVTKAAYDGGEQERVLAQVFDRHAEAVQFSFPRTARILHRLAASYRDEAQYEDVSSAFDQDQ